MNDPQAPRAPEPRARLKTLLLALALVLATLALIASQEARLKRLASRWSQTEAAASPDSSVRVGPLTVRDAPFIVEGLSMTLAPGEGGEILASMDAQDAFVFAWISRGGTVSVDLHGVERDDESDAFASFHEADEAQDGFGHFVAPFDGTHGWYWRNNGDAPVTISVTVGGYFDGLFVEDGEHSDAPGPHGPSQTGCCRSLETRLDSSTLRGAGPAVRGTHAGKAGAAVPSTVPAKSLDSGSGSRV